MLLGFDGRWIYNYQYLQPILKQNLAEALAAEKLQCWQCITTQRDDSENRYGHWQTSKIQGRLQLINNIDTVANNIVRVNLVGF